MPWPKTMRALGSAGLALGEEPVVRAYAKRVARDSGVPAAHVDEAAERVVEEFRRMPRTEQRRAVRRMWRGGGPIDALR